MSITLNEPRNPVTIHLNLVLVLLQEVLASLLHILLVRAILCNLLNLVNYNLAQLVSHLLVCIEQYDQLVRRLDIRLNATTYAYAISATLLLTD